MGQIMATLEGLRKRIERMKIPLLESEPWPPTEGTLEWAIMEGMKANGLEIPDKPANESGFMFLARLEAPRLWSDYHASD